jgi:ribosomal 30S subunit maturation factor RimM
MVPFSIWLTREQFPKLVEGEIYLSDLIGYKVLDESMADYGKVVEIGTNGVQDILCVEDLNGEIVEILLIDQFVTEINSEKKTVHINVPELI